MLVGSSLKSTASTFTNRYLGVEGPAPRESDATVTERLGHLGGRFSSPWGGLGGKSR